MDETNIRTEIIKAAPPAGVSVTSFLGVPLSDWVYIATIVYIFVQCLSILYKIWRQVKSKGR